MRASASQPEFGLLGAGAVGASLIGRLPSRTRSLGPVAAVSYRVASRIANSLRAGSAARNACDLDIARTVLFHAPADQTAALLSILREAELHWPGKSMVFCDCEDVAAAMAEFQSRGASVAAVSSSLIPGRLVLEGSPRALIVARRIARQLGMKHVEIRPGTYHCFQAALTLGNAALTPLIDHAAHLLRHCGVRDREAAALAVAIFEQTARDYAHSGKQSWSWYTRKPDVLHLEAQIDASGDVFRVAMRELILAGLCAFDRHPCTRKALEDARLYDYGEGP